jgi:hypothetical protein
MDVPGAATISTRPVTPAYPTGMTKKITISIPDDVAERLAAGDVENVSAYITEAVRRQIVVENTRAFLLERGINVTEEGVERWRRLLAERDAARSEDRWDSFDKRMRELREGTE